MLPIDTFVGNPKNIAEADNTTVTFDLERVYQYLKIKFRASGTLTLASYSTAPTKLAEAVENLYGLLTLTAVRKDQGGVNDVLKSVDLAYLRYLTNMMEGTDVNRTDVGTTNAAFNFNTTANLYFGDPRSDNKRLTILDSRLLNSLKLDVLFRSAAAMVTGGVGGTAVLSNTVVTLLATVFAGGRKVARPYLKETQQLFDVTQDQIDKEYPGLKIGNVIRRMAFKGTVGANQFSDPSDTPLNGNTSKAEGAHLRLVANGQYRPLDCNWKQLQDDNKELFAVEATRTGYAMYEAARNARIVESLNVIGAQTLSLLVDQKFTGSNTNEIQVTTTELVQPKAA